MRIINDNAANPITKTATIELSGLEVELLYHGLSRTGGADFTVIADRHELEEYDVCNVDGTLFLAFSELCNKLGLNK